MMSVQVNKSYMNSTLISENTFALKEECEDDDFVDDKVILSETVISVNGDLEDHLKYNLITESKVFSPFDNTKTELSLSEEQNNTINDSVKIEEGINPNDIKIEFHDRLLFCEQCQVYYRDYCIECGMVVHILNRNNLPNTDNGTQEELPNDILEIRESFGQFGIFALRVIPKDVKFGPFTGINASESNWKLKGGKFIVNEDKSKYLNWMQYVNPAKSNSEQNLLAFQYEDNLYYQSIRRIQEGEELLVYFREQYEDSLNGDVEMDFIPIAEQNFKDVFACTFCCLGFSSRIYLIKHKAICLNDAKGMFSVKELVQCPYCKVYLDEREYNEYHMVCCSQRNIGNCIPLILDNRKVDGKRDRTRRLEMYNCTQCNYKTKFKGDLESHSNYHYAVKMHLEKVHTNVEGIQFRKYFTSGANVYKSNKQFGYRCEICEYKTNRKTYLQNHIKSVHIKEFNYKCGVCEYKTNSKADLKKHTKTVHFKEFDYKCDMCEYKTNDRSNLQIHIKSKYLKEFNYKCGMCEYKTNTKSNLERHTKSVHLKEFDYKCDMCEYKTNDKLYIQIHLKSKHLKEFDYNCDMCEYKTDWKAHFVMHMKSVHVKEFNYKCGMCEFKTNRNSDLKKHTKTVHLKEFDYKCEICKFKTNQKTDLQIHIKSKHLKEFNYKCGMCEYKTNTKSQLGGHTKRMHLIEFDYKCDMCEYKTNNTSRFETHLKRKHSK